MDDIDVKDLQIVAKERTVKTQSIQYDLETLTKKIDKGYINLSPDYQRNHRWNDETSSRLVESLILNIPIPTIYLSVDVDVDDEVDDDIPRYSVIDGQQRLTAIYYFIKGKYSLKGLEVLKALNTLKYDDLPDFLVRRLEERTINCLRVDSTADTQVKFDIFERLNTGSIKLEPQELRNATCRGKFNDLIKELAQYSRYRELLQIKDIESDRKVAKMEDVENVLRFFALKYDEIQNMKSSLKNFLSEQLVRFNSLSNDKLQKEADIFRETIDIIYDNFGSLAFAKYKDKDKDGQLKIQSKFNVSVYDSLIIAIADNRKYGKLIINESKINKFKKLFMDEDYISYIEGSTSDKNKIINRINKVKEIFS